MSTITKCLKEWNATIEALGQGKQTILIRKYNTNVKEFLLYPTMNYIKNDNYLDDFQLEERLFVKMNALPYHDEDKIEIKYYAKVDSVIKKSSTRIGTFNKFHIWTQDHVKSYLERKPASIWLLRVYELKEPIMLSRTRGMRYANVNEPVSLEGIKPVLSDEEFNKIKGEILSK